MQSLAEIFQRVAQRPPGMPYAEPEPEQEVCQLCTGHGLVRQQVPLGHPAFGQLLPCVCQREHLEAKQGQAAEAYMELPKTRDPQTFANFKPVIGAEEAVEAAKAFSRGELSELILTLSAGAGRGKSHLLAAIGREASACGVLSKYVDAADYLDQLKASFDEHDGSTGRIQTAYREAPILLFDEIGLRDKPTDYDRAELKSLLDHRTNKGLATAVTTNLREGELEKLMGARLASRLWGTHSGTALVVVMRCGDYRRGG